MTDAEIKAARHRVTELRGFDKFDPPSSKDTDDAADLLSAALDDIERLNTLHLGDIPYEVERDALRAEVERLRIEHDRFAVIAMERFEEAEEVHALIGDPVQTRRPMIAGLRVEVERMREALITARYPCAVAASYVGDRTITIGLRMHAESCVAALRVIDAALETMGQTPLKAEPEMHCTGSLVHDEYTRCPVHDL
jgi:hypothetical protein